jgi:hypothetical protein
MTMDETTPIIQELLASSNPVIVYKTRTALLGENEASPAILHLRQQIRSSDLVKRLLMHRQSAGTIPLHPYTKWQGAHWTLSCLAEIGYPSGDPELLPLREQVYHWLLDERHLEPPHTVIYRGQEDRVRRCASMEGNTVWYLLRLGLEDERTGMLVERLKGWQWPDGGWNCDKRQQAHLSSFIETILPLRALSQWGQQKQQPDTIAAARRAAEVFLSRRLYKRLQDGSVIREEFTRLVYPSFYYYNILLALKILAEAGWIHDDRCNDALDLLENKRLPDGGFPASARVYQVSNQIKSRASPVSWGPVGTKRRNDYVTVEALAVLQATGRL